MLRVSVSQFVGDARDVLLAFKDELFSPFEPFFLDERKHAQAKHLPEIFFQLELIEAYLSR